MIRRLTTMVPLLVVPTAYAAAGYTAGLVVEGAKAAAALRAHYAHRTSLQQRYDSARRSRVIRRQMADMDRELGLLLGPHAACPVRPEGHLWAFTGTGASCLACTEVADEQEVRSW